MGRDKRNEQRTEHWTKLVRNMMETPAWQALSPIAQALYPWLRLEWRGPQNNNNGKISLSVRQAANRMGCSADAAARAFHDLQAKGFICVTKSGVLGFEGYGKSTEYELTELELPHDAKRGGRRLYKEWTKDREFPIHKSRRNNPSGANGKQKTHHQNDDSTVIEMWTAQSKPSSK